MEQYSNSDFAERFRIRTKAFVVSVIDLYRQLPLTTEAQIIGKQLLRSGSSVGANYRAACRARSQAEFHSKLCIVVEEADESIFWMEIIIDSHIIEASKINNLIVEANEILKVASSARKTVSDKIKSSG